ncbi:Cna B-type domain-containing protein [Streptococcus massiliensis]|uniref:Putative collagen adhesin n=5 Tax=Streptococcus massiliensis TaxID=313439 RepID=A0A380KS82_9STRE|nr:Cna B-type domain-containing protein [Streptococcus massiliensis]SUN72166.1 putative collagen adhesin [Streptococcus massiliensis]
MKKMIGILFKIIMVLSIAVLASSNSAVNAAARKNQDLSKYVKVKDFTIYNEKGNNSETNPIKTYDQFGLKATFDIDTKGAITIKEGDTVKFKTLGVDKKITALNGATTAWAELKGQINGVEKVIGQWRITSSQVIEIKFGKNSEGTSVIGSVSLDTGISRKAHVVSYTEGKAKSFEVTVGDYKKAVYFMGGTLTKEILTNSSKWASTKTNKLVEWGINVNADQIDKLSWDKYEVKQNVYLEDNLGEREFKGISFRLSTTYPMSLTDKTRSTQGLIKAFTNVFTEVQPDYTAYPTYESFKNSLKPLEYGVYKDGTNTRVVVYFGNFDKTAPKYSTVWPTMYEDVANYAIEKGYYKQEDKEKLKEILEKTYGSTNVIEGSIPAWLVYIDVDYPLAISDTKVSNTVDVTYDGNKVTKSAETTMNGLLGTTKLSSLEAGLVKVNSTGNALAGAEIALEKFENNKWVQAKNVQGKEYKALTNAKGMVKFEQLAAGKYRFVETKAPVPYDKDSLTFTDKQGKALPNGEFTVNASDAEGHLLIAKNSVLKDKIKVSVEKKWVGTKQNKVEVTLVADGKETNKTLELSDSNSWKSEFSGLSKYDSEDGHVIKYTIKELNLPDYYTSKITGDANTGFTITNTYIPADPIQVPLVAEKVLEGKSLEANKYQFKLFKVTNGTEQEVEAVTNKQDGSITFTPLAFNEDEVGEHDYVVREVIPADSEKEAGVTYDKTEFKVKIKVEKAFGRKLKATITRSPEELVFKNKYTAKSVNVPLSVTKKLTGRELKADEFEFVLKDKAGKTVETVKNTADGQVNFKALEFTKTGTYVYTISETKGNLGGISYDTHQVTATIEVTDDGSGQLKAKTSYKDNNQTFNNTYTTKKTTAELKATKKLTGKNLVKDQFEFVLKDKDGNDLQTVKNTADGQVKFAALEYDKVGTYTYTITEKEGGKDIEGIHYDDLTVTATVTVTDDGKGNLRASVAYSGDTEFNNTYAAAKPIEVALQAKKLLNGKELEGEQFEFILRNEQGKEVSRAKNAQDGTVTFPTLTYNENQVGTYKFTIEEVAGNETGISYDSHKLEVEVKVEKVSATELKATVSKGVDDLTFTNTYTPASAAQAEIAGKKVLSGKALTAGQYNFVLKKEDGTVVETVQNKADGSFKFTPIQYTEDQIGTHKYTVSEVEGSEVGITYDKTVKEVTVTVTKDNATNSLKVKVSTKADDLTFTNTYTPAKTQVKVTKNWDDANNQDGKRVASVTVKLLADGVDTGKTAELNEANNWTATFDNLDADKGGTPITYKVVEETVIQGYTPEITGDANTGFTITNKYVPETVDLTVHKNWDDANNQDGIRPKEITVHLLADGQKVDSKKIEANAAGKWSTTFTNKPKYKNGKEIKYTVVEETVSEYKGTTDGLNITNSYTPKVVDYEVTKKWDDNDNQDGKRPKEITVHLMKTVDGVKTKVATKVVTEADSWKYTFTNLPKYEAGKEITYSVEEDKVEGYDTKVDGHEITNTHTPEMIKISGEKVWDDANNQDGKRPKEITIEIRKKDSKDLVDSITVTPDANGNWKFTSKDLPKYENGKEIIYEVSEKRVEHYETTITPSTNGQYTITNTYTPEKTMISGEKVWDDANNQDGIRPDKIIVHLLANGEDTGQVATASAETNWTYRFSDLPVYKDGKKIEYSVKEDKVEGYETSLKGFTIINSHKPTEPTPPSTPNQPKKILPKTGEVMSWLGGLGALLLVGLGGTYSRRKH